MLQCSRLLEQRRAVCYLQEREIRSLSKSSCDNLTLFFLPLPFSFCFNSFLLLSVYLEDLFPNGGYIYGGFTSARFRFFPNFHFDSTKNLIEVLHFFPLLNFGGKKIGKKSSVWPSLEICQVFSKSKKYRSRRPICTIIGTNSLNTE